MKHLRIPILGDLHGDMEALAWLSEHAAPDLILQVGDLGHYPGLIEERLRGRNVTPNGRRVPVHWCAGNHECWPLLADLTKPTEVAPGVIYQPTGSTLTLPDDRVVLFVGGAKSVDWPLRMEGVSV